MKLDHQNRLFQQVRICVMIHLHSGSPAQVLLAVSPSHTVTDLIPSCPSAPLQYLCLGFTYCTDISVIAPFELNPLVIQPSGVKIQMCYRSCCLCSRPGLCPVTRHCFQSCLVSFLLHKYLIHSHHSLWKKKSLSWYSGKFRVFFLTLKMGIRQVMLAVT